MRDIIRRWMCARRQRLRERRKKERWERFFREGGAAQYFRAGGAIR